MASSRIPVPLDRLRLGRSPVTPGSLGCNGAADPNRWFHLPGVRIAPGDSPGSLGCNDRATFGLEYLAGVELVPPGGLGRTPPATWQYDPQNLLGDPNLCPGFVTTARKALETAVNSGLWPRVHEAYRTPAESDRKHEHWKETGQGWAVPGWTSCHNYGLAMDVWLFDANGRYINNTNTKGWYKFYRSMDRAAVGLTWGANFRHGDSDHWEYHPNWQGGAGGKFLIKVRDWASAAAAFGQEPGHGARRSKPTDAEWLPYFWWAAGAGGIAPPADYLVHHPVPVHK